MVCVLEECKKDFLLNEHIQIFLYGSKLTSKYDKTGIR